MTEYVRIESNYTLSSDKFFSTDQMDLNLLLSNSINDYSTYFNSNSNFDSIFTIKIKACSVPFLKTEFYFYFKNTDVIHVRSTEFKK